MLDITTGAALTTGATIQGYTLNTVANQITASIDEDQGLSDDAVVNDPSATGINVTGAETNSTVEYALNDGAYVASYDDIKGSIADGDTVNVRHTDLAGNVSSTSVTVTVDTTAPEMDGVADEFGVKTSGHVVYTVTFNKAVLPGSIDLADFVFTGSDLTPSGVITEVEGFGDAANGFTKADIRLMSTVRGYSRPRWPLPRPSWTWPGIISRSHRETRALTRTSSAPTWTTCVRA